MTDESDRCQHRYPGQYRNEENSLYYNWHRFYDPHIGRYVQADPIGLIAGPNLFSYAGNNPLIFIDPLGLSKEAWWHGIANFWIGVGDAGSFGLTKWIRSTDFYGGDDFTDEFSHSYVAGDLLGQIAITIATWGTGELPLASKLSKESSYVRNHVFRWGVGRVSLSRGIDIRKLHVHIGLGSKNLLEHHLPHQMTNWMKNLYHQYFVKLL